MFRADTLWLWNPLNQKEKKAFPASARPCSFVGSSAALIMFPRKEKPSLPVPPRFGKWKLPQNVGTNSEDTAQGKKQRRDLLESWQRWRNCRDGRAAGGPLLEGLGALCAPSAAPKCKCTLCKTCTQRWQLLHTWGRCSQPQHSIRHRGGSHAATAANPEVLFLPANCCCSQWGGNPNAALLGTGAQQSR